MAFVHREREGRAFLLKEILGKDKYRACIQGGPPGPSPNPLMPKSFR
jgi:hypothetical protein